MAIQKDVSFLPFLQIQFFDDELKKLVATVDYVKNRMVICLSTGSIAAFIFDNLGALIDIVGVPTSKSTQEQAAALYIPLSTLDAHSHLDLAINDADEVEPNLDLVKGRGGALLCEKMIEAAYDQFIVVANNSKLVSGLGGSGLVMPIKVMQFCWNYNLVRLHELFGEKGYEANLKKGGSMCEENIFVKEMRGGCA